MSLWTIERVESVNLLQRHAPMRALGTPPAEPRLREELVEAAPATHDARGVGVSDVLQSQRCARLQAALASAKRRTTERASGAAELINEIVDLKGHLRITAIRSRVYPAVRFDAFARVDFAMVGRRTSHRRIDAESLAVSGFDT